MSCKTPNQLECNQSPVPKIIKRKRNSKNVSRGYFGDYEESLVIEFKNCDTDERKNEIFTELLCKFDYLINSLMFTFRIPIHMSDDVDFIKQDCRFFIYKGMDKYDPNKKSKNTGKPSRFYSYCSVIVSNYLRQLIKKHKNKKRFYDNLSQEYANSSAHQYNDSVLEKIEEDEALRNFVLTLQSDMHKWRDEVVKPNDVKVLEAIIKIFEDLERLESLDKKEIYFLIKEITGLKSQQINGSLKNLRKIYIKARKQYYGPKQEQ